MDRFGKNKQAKDYLAGRIIAEVSREGAPLPEIKQKTLYFSETDRTLPDLAKVSGILVTTFVTKSGTNGLMLIGSWLLGCRFWVVVDWFLSDRSHAWLIVLSAQLSGFSGPSAAI